MPNPHDVLSQLLSPSQADTLQRGAADAWAAAASALGAILGAAPRMDDVDGRLVMPEEVVKEFGAPHLVAPIELSTDQEQTALAYVVLSTPVAAAFFDSRADDPGDEEQQTIVMASTVLGQVLQVLNTRVFGASPTGLVLSIDDLAANTMPALLSTMDEPLLLLAATVQGEKPLPLTVLLPGTFLDIVAGSLPEAGEAGAEPAPSLSITQDDLEAAELVELPATPDLRSAPVPPDPAPEPFREPTPISQAPAAARARFSPLPDPKPSPARQAIDLLRGLQMNVTVELGRTELTVAEVLDLGPGSVIELDRVAGEPVDILVNDRIIARGEVVVVDENFGVRVVEVLRRGVEAEEEAV